MTSMTPNHEQNQNNLQNQGGAQRSARSLMNSLYRSPRARKNGAPDAEDTVPLAISTEVTPVETDTEASQGETSQPKTCLLYTSPSPRDRTRSRMPSSA